jgi:hypothetical protein
MDIVERLNQIADAIADGDHSELTMRVPAEPDRDADIVVSNAAREITRLRAELAAYKNAPVLATLGPCCGLIRIGDKPEGVVHTGMCRERHGGVLGPTIKLIARKGKGGVMSRLGQCVIDGNVHTLPRFYADVIVKLTDELAECRERLLGIYDNLSDPPVPEEHMQAMCKRIEEMFPDVFDEARKVGGE